MCIRDSAESLSLKDVTVGYDENGVYQDGNGVNGIYLVQAENDTNDNIRILGSTMGLHSAEKPLYLGIENGRVSGRLIAACDTAEIAKRLRSSFYVTTGTLGVVADAAGEGTGRLTLGVYAAQIGEEYFTSIDSAVSYAAANRETLDNQATIILLADAVQNSIVTIPAGLDITITDDGTGRKITRGSGFTDALFTFTENSGSTLTFAASDNEKPVSYTHLDVYKRQPED